MKYKTFSVLIYSNITASGNWKNEKLCGNTTPAGRSVFTQFRVFQIFPSVDITVCQYGKNVLYFFYNIAQRTLTEERREIFRVDIELYQHGSQPISVQNLQMLYYKDKYYNHGLALSINRYCIYIAARRQMCLLYLLNCFVISDVV